MRTRTHYTVQERTGWEGGGKGKKRAEGKWVERGGRQCKQRSCCNIWPGNSYYRRSVYACVHCMPIQIWLMTVLHMLHKQLAAMYRMSVPCTHTHARTHTHSLALPINSQLQPHSDEWPHSTICNTPRMALFTAVTCQTAHTPLQTVYTIETSHYDQPLSTLPDNSVTEVLQVPSPMKSVWKGNMESWQQGCARVVELQTKCAT